MQHSNVVHIGTGVPLNSIEELIEYYGGYWWHICQGHGYVMLTKNTICGCCGKDQYGHINLLRKVNTNE